jgi:DNA-binding transcriptional regulator YiaG
MNFQTSHTYAVHDVSDLIGLKVIVMNAAIEMTDEDGETSIRVPDIQTASAAAALARCLMPVRLRGHELKAIRRILGMTAAQLAESMDGASIETVSRWENEKQAIGGYAEKVFRLVMCERLRERAPAISYEDGMIARLKLVDPWRENPDYEIPAIQIERVRMKVDHSVINAWSAGIDKIAA